MRHRLRIAAFETMLICEEAIPLTRSLRGPLLDHFVGAQQIDCGTVSPSALAVLALTAISNLTGT